MKFDERTYTKMKRNYQADPCLKPADRVLLQWIIDHCDDELCVNPTNNYIARHVLYFKEPASVSKVLKRLVHNSYITMTSHNITPAGGSHRIVQLNPNFVYAWEPDPNEPPDGASEYDIRFDDPKAKEKFEKTFSFLY